jgi:hypothetical protein
MEKEAHAYYKKANEDKMIVDIFDRCETISDLFDMESRMKDVMTGMTIREYEKQNSDKMYIRLNIGSEDDGI